MIPNPKKALLALLACVLIATESRAAGFAVDGRVVTPNGEGLAGARIELRPVLRLYEEDRRELAGKPAPPPLRVVRSGPGGWFHLEAPAEASGACWRLAVSADGFVSSISGPVVPLDDRNLYDIALEPDIGLVVRVIDPAGQAVAGARVAIIRASPSPSPWHPMPRIAMTGLDGTVRLPRSAGEIGSIRASAPGFPAVSQPETESANAILRLQPGRRVALRIVDQGKTVAKAMIRDIGSGLLLGSSDENGLLQVDHPLSDPWSLRADLPDGRIAHFELPVLSAAWISPIGRRQLSLQIPPAAAIVGKVVDMTTRRPLAGALVVFGEDPAASARTDSLGVYRLGGTRDVPAQVVAFAAGYSSESGFLTPVEPAPTLALLAVGAITGIVEDEQGQPLAGAEVYLKDLPQWRTSTSESGRFRLNADLGVSYGVIAARPGLAPALVHVTVPNPPDRLPDLRLTLLRGARVEGRIVDETGSPVAAADVALRREDAAVHERSPEALPKTVSGDDGRFGLSALPYGWLELHASANGIAAHPRRFEVAASTTIDLGDVVLDRGEPLEVQVTDPAGEPLEGAEAWARTADPLFRETPRRIGVTGPNGRLTIFGGSPEIEICRDGFMSEKIPDLEPGEPSSKPLEVVLETAVRISGRIVDPEGLPVAGALLQGSNGNKSIPFHDCAATAAANEDWTSSFDRDGRFSISVGAPLRFSLRATAKGYLPATRDLEVRPGQDLEDVVLALDPGLTVTGTVSTPEGEPAMGAQVSVRLRDSRLSVEGVTDGDGRFRLDGVERGLSDFLATHEDFDDAGLEAEVGGPESRFDLVLGLKREHHTLRGRIEGPAGEPVAGAQIVERGGSFSDNGAWAPKGEGFSNTDGTFVLEVGGKSDLYVSKCGYSPTTADASSLPPDVWEGLVIRLPYGGSVTGRLLGLPPESLARVSVEAISSGSLPGYVEPDGTYRIPDLGPGDWSVAATVGKRMAHGNVTLMAEHPDAVLDLTFDEAPPE